MDPKNPMFVEPDGRIKSETISIDQFHKNICTKQLLLVLCVLDDVNVKEITARLEVHSQSGVCYLDTNKYGYDASVQRSTMECANTDFN